LLGCYERELAGLVEKLCLYPYTEIIDIGCAEGYYANGFARRHRQAFVYAFDSDPRARHLCRQMALLNEVADRVSVNDDCLRIEISSALEAMFRRHGFHVTRINPSYAPGSVKPGIHVNSGSESSLHLRGAVEPLQPPG
jgi:methylase of polypeptide subunit release factors